MRHGHLPPTQGGVSNKKHDSRAPSPPNSEIYVFTRPHRKEGGGIYLSIASKEEDGVQDIADAMTATAGQGFPPSLPPQPHPTPARTSKAMAFGWVPRGSRPPSSDLPWGRRCNHRNASTLHRLHATHVTEETIHSISKRPPAARDRAALTSQRPPPPVPKPPSGRALVDHALTHGCSGRSRTHQEHRRRARTSTSRSRVEFFPLSPREEPGARIPAAPFPGVAAFSDEEGRSKWGGTGGGLGFHPPRSPGGGDAGERTGLSECQIFPI
jgi:hypothetical protein